jgi:N-acetylglucosaminyldiphosphoundecaprenol N-acetyl-beta-D-mannosaminyltransferase
MVAELATDLTALDGQWTAARSGGALCRGWHNRWRVEIGGVHIDRVDLQSALTRIQAFLDCGQTHQIATVNLDFVTLARKDSTFRDTVNRADLVVPDGMPLVWLSHLRGEPVPERVTGVELVERSCQLAAQTGRGVFLLGAAPGVAVAAARTLQQRHPGLRVVGSYSPSFGSAMAAENERIIAMIRDAAPAFLFVALGAPRQDLWIDAHRDRLRVPVAIGVGGTLDILAGAVQRAPGWMQHSGLEWTYRLAQEPGRLWRRYLLNDLPMFGRLLVAARSRPLEAHGMHGMPGVATHGGAAD